MGIRFACHVCAKQLNIKEELSGKRGICPACSSKFRIPKQDAERSLAIEDPPQAVATSNQPATESLTVSPGKNQKQAEASPATAKPKVEIDVLSSDPDATWYVRPPSGGQYGPADGDVLRAWIGEGRVAATALLWRDGWPNWRAANEVLPGLSGSSPKTSPSLSTAPAPPQTSEQPVVETPTLAKNSDLGTTPAVAETPALSGRSDIGTTRRQKNGKRIFWIGALLVIAVVLIGVLFYLVWGSG